jgi:signal transduction histidine kinase
MIEYIKKRASGKVSFSLDTKGETYIPAMISPPLFDWVVENLLKNALDAMEGKGQISLKVRDHATQVLMM